MKISEVIKKLQEIQKEHGDLEVLSGYCDIDEENIFLCGDNVVEIG